MVPRSSVAASSSGVGIRMERKLEECEFGAVEADAPLAEEDRAGTGGADAEGDEAEEWREEEQGECGGGAVEEGLDGELPAAEVGAAEVEDGKPADGVVGGAVVPEVEESRDEGDFEAHAFAAADEFDDGAVGGGGEGDDDLFDVVFGDDAVEVVESAEEGCGAAADFVFGEGAVVEEADGREAVVGGASEAAGEAGANGAGSDDERWALADAAQEAGAWW